MYAVVKTGGKQYRVAKNDILTVEKLEGDAGTTVELGEVLAVDDGKALTVGAPVIDGARVAAEVLEQKKSDKVLIFKKKRRKNYRRTRGHRQQLTVIRITDILAKGQKASAAAKAASIPEADTDAKPKTAAKKAPAKKAAAKAKAKTTAKSKAKTAAKKSVKSKTAAKKPAKGK
jgi:large subunit ribosomal protein L21